jgi:hypothetical protein
MIDGEVGGWLQVGAGAGVREAKRRVFEEVESGSGEGRGESGAMSGAEDASDGGCAGRLVRVGAEAATRQLLERAALGR